MNEIEKCLLRERWTKLKDIKEEKTKDNVVLSSGEIIREVPSIQEQFLYSHCNRYRVGISKDGGNKWIPDKLFKTETSAFEYIEQLTKTSNNENIQYYPFEE
jgi:hypothetical protein